MDVNKHRQKLLDMVRRGLTNEQIQEEIKHVFGEDNWLFELKEFLQRQVNSRISYKSKDRYNSDRMYFELRNKVEDDVILSTNWHSYFENIDLTELQTFNGDCKPLQAATLMMVTIEALKAYVDMGEEANPRCLVLQNIYTNLKQTLSSTTDIHFPIGDAFQEYLRLKSHREEIEDARLTGSICPNCGSHDVKSFGANWKCRSCQREFRKHIKPKEE